MFQQMQVGNTIELILSVRCKTQGRAGTAPFHSCPGSDRVVLLRPATTDPPAAAGVCAEDRSRPWPGGPQHLTRPRRAPEHAGRRRQFGRFGPATVLSANKQRLTLAATE